MRAILSIIAILLLVLIIQVSRIKTDLMDYRPQRHEHLYYDVTVEPGASVVIKENADG